MAFALKVNNAGIKRINGIYYPTEHLHGDSPVYSKTGDYHDREDDDFLLWLFHDHWVISTLKRREVLGNYGKYFYCCKNNAGAVDDITRNLNLSDNSIPPSNGWKVDVHGCSPAPKVTILQRKIHTSTSSSSLCSDSDSGDTSRTSISNINIMERILFQEQWSDVHFHCPDSCKVLHAHKVILCASSRYFAKKFSKNNYSSDGNGKDPDGVWTSSYSYRLTKFLLTFLYTGTTSAEVVIKHPFEVLSMARKYQLPVLVKRVEKALIESIDKYNVKTLLQTSSQHNLCELKESCFEFIQKNMINVLTDETFMKLAFEDNLLWSELKSYLAPFESRVS